MNKEEEAAARNLLSNDTCGFGLVHFKLLDIN